MKTSDKIGAAVGGILLGCVLAIVVALTYKLVVWIVHL